MTTHLLLACIEAPAPIDGVVLASDGRSLVALDFGLPEGRLRRMLVRRYGPDIRMTEADDPQGFASAIRAYLSGRIDAVSTLPADGGGSPFQAQVWAALRTIPPGETRSYGQIARLIGRPGASRAVGLANGRNPVNLVVPCHRVIGSGGALTGYGGGLDRKSWLLDHERAASDGQGDLLRHAGVFAGTPAIPPRAA